MYGNYDDGLQYDVSTHRKEYYYTLPSNLVDVSLICSSVSDPGVVLVNGLDFEIRDGAIVTHIALFDTPDFVRGPVASENSDQADSVHVWLYDASFDYSDMYNLFGYLVRIKKESSSQYNRIVNAYIDCLASGTTFETFVRFLSACVGEPMVKEDGETVVNIYVDSEWATVITDTQVYKYAATSNSLVTVGQRLHAGQLLSDAIRVWRNLLTADLPVASLDVKLLAACLPSAISLENRNVPLNVSTVGGLTKVSWDMPGDPAAAAAFFDYTMRVGITATQQDITCAPAADVITLQNSDGSLTKYHKGTLAHYLDTRTNLNSEPTAASLPATINPYKFVASNLLSHSLPVVQLKVSPAITNAQLDVLQLAVKLMPPQFGLYFVLEFPKQAEAVTIANINENISTMSAMVVEVEAINAASVDVSSITFRIV